MRQGELVGQVWLLRLLWMVVVLYLRMAGIGLGGLTGGDGVGSLLVFFCFPWRVLSCL